MYRLDGNSSIAILIVLVYFVFESPESLILGDHDDK